MFTSTMFASILPEILILVLGILILVVEPFWKEEKRRNVGWLTAGGLLVAMVVSLLFAQPGEPTATLGGMVRFDWLGFFFKMLFMFAGAATALLFMDNEKIGHRGEAYILLLASLLGMDLMAVSADLVMLYLAIETTSIPLYILSGFLLADDKSTEAGFKYLLFGALASTIMLYGFSLIFGFTGTTNLYQLAEMLKVGNLAPLTAFSTLGLILVGLGFKVSFVPFHFWAPDVYEGAPTPVSGFLSTASKAAGFAVLVRLFFVAFPDFAVSWTLVLAIISAVTMTVGNLLTLQQTNIKRLLAYSSVAHLRFRGIAVALFIALLISVYSAIDGAAVKLGYATPYVMTMFALVPIPITPFMIRQYGWNHLWQEFKAQGLRLSLMGLLGVSAYLLAVLAYSIAPLSYSGAIREVSVVFGALAGWWFLKERMGGMRVLGALVIFAGILVIAIFG